MSDRAKNRFPAVIDDAIVYPDSDGKPMADCTRHYQYIILLQVNLDIMFRSDPNVFVAADLFWYPVKGRPDIRMAPDTMVVFGRPKGHRGSYKQWEEENVAPQVAFEIRTPRNTKKEMLEKHRFYERFGVQEYYEYDLDHGVLKIWQRNAGALKTVDFVEAWNSPLLGITLKLEAGELSVYESDGQKFLPPVELVRRARQIELNRIIAEQERTRAEQVRKQTEKIKQETARLAAKLRELGIDPATL